MSTKYELLNNAWGSKAAALEHIYRIRETVKNGQRIEGMNALLLVAATNQHFDAEQKRGCGISHFTTGYSRHGTRCFVLHRLDGTSTDISFAEIFDDHAKIGRARIYKGLRDTIDSQVAKLRKSGHHVHHDPPFEELVTSWLAARGITIDDVEVAPSTDNQVYTGLKEAGMAYDWAAYHLEHARYEVLTIAEHRALKHRKGGNP